MKFPAAVTSRWLAVAPVDIRLAANGLSLHVQQTLRADPCDGSTFLFSSKRGIFALSMNCLAMATEWNTTP